MVDEGLPSSDGSSRRKDEGLSSSDSNRTRRSHTRSLGLDDTPDLLARCKAGELEAFDEFVHRYEKFIFNIIYQHLGAKDEVEDLAQEVFIRVFRSIHKFRGEASLETWLYRIALNCIRTYRKSKGSFFRFFLQSLRIDVDDDRKQPQPFETISKVIKEIDDPMQAMEHQVIVSEVMAVVRSLPPKYRELILMRDVDGLSYSEIARIVGVSIGTVKSRLNRARQLIRKRVSI